MRRDPTGLPFLLTFAALWALSSAAAPAQAGLKAPAQMPPEVGVGVELVLAVDVSRSMDEGELAIQRKGYANAFRSADVQEAILEGGWGRVAITYVEWAGAHSQLVMIPWTLIDSRKAAEDFANRIDAEGLTSQSRTSISGAIDFSAGLFRNNGFRGLRRVIDISGDGPNNDGGPVTAARDAALGQRITINGLPLMTNKEGQGFYGWGSIPHLDLYYADCVVGGPNSFSLPVTDWNQFEGAVRRKLVLELAGRRPVAPAVIVPVQAAAGDEAPTDCMVGEKQWQKRWGGGN